METIEEACMAESKAEQEFGLASAKVEKGMQKPGESRITPRVRCRGPIDKGKVGRKGRSNGGGVETRSKRRWVRK
jgi:hypothetical protein